MDPEEKQQQQAKEGSGSNADTDPNNNNNNSTVMNNNDQHDDESTEEEEEEEDGQIVEVEYVNPDTKDVITSANRDERIVTDKMNQATNAGIPTKTKTKTTTTTTTSGEPPNPRPPDPLQSEPATLLATLDGSISGRGGSGSGTVTIATTDTATTTSAAAAATTSNMATADDHGNNNHKGRRPDLETVTAAVTTSQGGDQGTHDVSKQETLDLVAETEGNKGEESNQQANYALTNDNKDEQVKVHQRDDQDKSLSNQGHSSSTWPAQPNDHIDAVDKAKIHTETTIIQGHTTIPEATVSASNEESAPTDAATKHKVGRTIEGSNMPPIIIGGRPSDAAKEEAVATLLTNTDQPVAMAMVAMVALNEGKDVEMAENEHEVGPDEDNNKRRQQYQHQQHDPDEKPDSGFSQEKEVLKPPKKKGMDYKRIAQKNNADQKSQPISGVLEGERNDDGDGGAIQPHQDPIESTRKERTTTSSSLPATTASSSAGLGAPSASLAPSAAAESTITVGAALLDPTERLNRDARDARVDFARDKDLINQTSATAMPTATTTTTTVRESFLSDSLTEEERRTRTRYIPSVEGMHSLRKQEIKNDLILARAAVAAAAALAISNNKSSSSTSSRRKTSSRQSNTAASSEEDVSAMMDVDEYETTSPHSEDERGQTDGQRPGTRFIEIAGTGMTITVPSNAFVVNTGVLATGADKAGSGKQQQQQQVKATLPSLVDSIAAFSAPRPPESDGGKKKHRMLRWERRPADIDVDLTNYRKTVQRTRDELKHAEAEVERLEIVDNHMGRNFLTHIQLLNEEMIRLNDELATLQQACINAADLLTSRTRSRGAGKGSYIMRDVINVLRARGHEIESKNLSLTGENVVIEEGENKGRGVGGVGGSSFLQDHWDGLSSRTTIPSRSMASAWIVPGDQVRSPYGNGTVLVVYPASRLDVHDIPHEALLIRNAGTVAADKETKAKPQTRLKSKEKKSSEGSSLMNIRFFNKALPPRVAVRLPYGIGFFSPSALTSLENPATYTDARMAKRWEEMLKTAKDVAGSIDVEGMATYVPNPLSGGDSHTSAMDTIEDMSNSKRKDDTTTILARGGIDGNDPIIAASAGTSTGGGKKRRLLSYGSNLLPTAVGRGNYIWTGNLQELDQALYPALYEESGILAFSGNPGVPNDVKVLEEDNEEYLTLQGQVLQLRNELYRQRRTRILNERTHAGTQERAIRFEALVGEMRTDLKTLKERLDDEVRDLGISDEQARAIFWEYFGSLDSPHEHDAEMGDLLIPPKRPRRESRGVEYEGDDEMDEDAIQDRVGSVVQQQHEQQPATNKQ